MKAGDNFELFFMRELLLVLRWSSLEEQRFELKKGNKWVVCNAAAEAFVRW